VFALASGTSAASSTAVLDGGVVRPSTKVSYNTYVTNQKTKRSPTRSPQTTMRVSRKPDVHRTSRILMRSEQTERLLAKVDVDSLHSATESEFRLEKVISETSEVKHDFEASAVKLNEMANGLAVDIHKWSEYLRMSHQLQKANKQIAKMWESRPERYGGDSVDIALREQSEDRDRDIEQIQGHIFALEAELDSVNLVASSVSEELQNKSRALGVDMSASAQVYWRGDTSKSPESTHLYKQDTWEVHNTEVFTASEKCLHSALVLLQSGNKLWKVLAENDAECYEAVTKAVNEKLKEWQELIVDLSHQMSDRRAEIQEMKHLCKKVKSKLDQVKQAVLRPEGKLVTRQARPGMEYKADTAEESLFMEVDQLRSSEKELAEHLSELEQEKERLQSELWDLEMELKDAESAQEVDKRCNKKISTYGVYIMQMLESARC